MYLDTLFALFSRFGESMVDTLCLHNNASNLNTPAMPQVPQADTIANSRKISVTPVDPSVIWHLMEAYFVILLVAFLYILFLMDNS